MLVFISGSINSGKTTTARALAEQIGAEVIHVDDLNDHIPKFNLATDLDKSMDMAIRTINEHSANGENVVADYVVRPEDYARFDTEILTHPQIVITLAPALEVAQSQRGDRTLTEWEVKRIKYHYDSGIATPNFGHTIDNSKLTVDETISEIINIIAKQAMHWEQ